MRLVFKTFGDENQGKENALNFNWSAGHEATLTTEEPSDLVLPAHIQYRPAGYHNVGDAACVIVSERYSPEYTAWKRTQAEEPDLSLLLGQYMEFWTAWNVRAEALVEEQTKVRLAQEAAALEENKQQIEKIFPGIVPLPTGSSLDGWSYHDLMHNGFVLNNKDDVHFHVTFNGKQWCLTLKSNFIRTEYDIKKAKNIKNIFKFILEAEEVKYYNQQHNERKERDRKQKVLQAEMKAAGWEYQGGSEWEKQKESGRYVAKAKIQDDSDQVIIFSVRRYIENLMLTPNKMDISIFE